MDKTRLHELLDTLIVKYCDNDYVEGRLCNYIEKLLPSALENAKKTHQQREERKQKLTGFRNEFTERFMHKNNYFYSPQKELFLHYDGTHFMIYSEDDIQYQILTTITQEQSLRDWKHKINLNIIKLIKERSPLTAIPESATIQYVINTLYPSVFSSRNHAKYFLTIIGDCLSGKTESDIVYITSPAMKDFIREIENYCYTYFGQSNAFHCIKYKYYDHNYQACRLLHINDERWTEVSKFDVKKGKDHYNKGLEMSSSLCKHMMDVFCVGAHYSKRYGSSDGFLKQCSETSLVDHALYLHRNTPESIVDSFIEKSIQTCPSSSIKHKNMIYIWKKFLEEKNVPNIIFYDSLTAILRGKIEYNQETETFRDVTSVHLPLVANFLQFWETTMVEDETEPELEIDEMSSILKNWAGRSYVNASDALLMELIRHFHPDVVIEEDKYILNMKCNLWDKRMEATSSLDLFKLSCNDEENLSTQSLYAAYQFYSTNNKSEYTFSKRYFEKIAIDVVGEFLDKDGLISPQWWA
jgi:hypothetical protein